MECSAETMALLRLKLTPGLGPVLIERVVERHGLAAAAIGAAEEFGAAAFSGIERLGKEKARGIAAGIGGTVELAKRELEELDRVGGRLVGQGDAAYPALLKQVPAAPVVLSCRGELDGDSDRLSVAIVGSRRCTAYGAEQAERFAAGLGQAGLSIISGGARGIDTHCHAAALRAGARTVVVLGCGLSECYPPENRDLFQRVIDSGGAVVSELAAKAAPEAKNFPARNRIISGMSLGTLVIEAGKKSGALITARVAAEDQGREVLALPGRVDSDSSAGCLELLRSGAAMAVSPADVLEALEAPARHLHGETFEARYSEPGARPAVVETKKALPADLNEAQRVICEALVEAKTLDELARTTGLTAEVLRSEATMLELRRVLVREGARLRVRGAR